MEPNEMMHFDVKYCNMYYSRLVVSLKIDDKESITRLTLFMMASYVTSIKYCLWRYICGA